MPNIYLRMPTSRCQFFRHRDPKHILEPSDPIVFSNYSPEYFVIRQSLSNVSAVIQKISTQCFSHQQWLNMVNGRHPSGGKVLNKRDRHLPLTYGEVLQLNGVIEYDRSIKEDYLCIKLPATVEVVDTVRQVTPSWNIDTNGRRRLLEMLNSDFKRSVMEWVLSTFDYCTSRGRLILRSQTSSMERFLMRYGIEPSDVERDSLRRMIERWLKTDRHCLFSAYSCVDMQYIDDGEKSINIEGIQWL